MPTTKSLNPYNEKLESLWLFFLPDDPQAHGFLLGSVVQRMPWTPDFRLIVTPRKEVHLIRQDRETWQEACVKAIDEVLDLAHEKNIFPRLGKKRDEQFPIAGASFDIGIERSASSLFGIMVRGHI